MEILISVVDFLNDYFRPILIFITSFFAVYFAMQKIGNKVIATYTTTSGLKYTTYISAVTLTNKKDNSFAIWSIYAVIDKDYCLELDKFDEPVVVKPYETISLSMPEYSQLYCGEEKYSSYFPSEKVEIYINIGNKEVKCRKNIVKASDFPLEATNKIYKEVQKFDTHIYNENVKFILVYCLDEKYHTAFINEHGVIYNEWFMMPNGIKGTVTAQAINIFLETNRFNEIFSNYECYEMQYPNYKLAFYKNQESI